MIEDFKNAGIFGMIQSGKTTLAKKISLYYAGTGRPTLVLDPQDTIWGAHATKFGLSQEKEFFEAAWKNQNCLIVVDEAAATIRRERELIPIFTRLHHNGHRILVVGHGGADLLPTMRRQLNQIFLFRQSADEAREWAREFTQESVFQSAQLMQFQYLHCGRFTPAKIYKMENL
jgi:hypothetical protein